MIMNRSKLLTAAPIKNMEKGKKIAHGRSYGLSHAGYDIRIKQTVVFLNLLLFRLVFIKGDNGWSMKFGNFALASAIEEFQMTNNLVGIVHDKSSNAREAISVFNTVIEPGWKGFLTLELVFHGIKPIVLKSGTPIAQVIFHKIAEHSEYKGKYQNQQNKPVKAIREESRRNKVEKTK